MVRLNLSGLVVLHHAIHEDEGIYLFAVPEHKLGMLKSSLILCIRHLGKDALLKQKTSELVVPIISLLKGLKEKTNKA